MYTKQRLVIDGRRHIYFWVCISETLSFFYSIFGFDLLSTYCISFETNMQATHLSKLLTIILPILCIPQQCWRDFVSLLQRTLIGCRPSISSCLRFYDGLVHKLFSVNNHSSKCSFIYFTMVRIHNSLQELVLNIL